MLLSPVASSRLLLRDESGACRRAIMCVQESMPAPDSKYEYTTELAGERIIRWRSRLLEGDLFGVHLEVRENEFVGVQSRPGRERPSN